MSVVSLRSPATARRASAVYCAVYGSGAPLVMLHGIGSSGMVFQSLIDAFSAGHQVIVPDLRGHGHSRRLPAADSIDRLADDVSDVLALLRCGPCAVIGHAEGAAVALQLARQQPTAVDALILLEPRLTVAGHGIATCEEIVAVGRDGARFLSRPQEKLYLVR